MLGFLLGRSRNKSKEEAKQRLIMVLAYERKGLPPNFVDRIKDDLISVFSKYANFDVGKIEVNIKRDQSSFDELWISIPFKE